MKNRAMTLTLSGLAGLSLWTSVALAQGADQGIPLVCRPPEAGETPNAYIPTSQNAGQNAQARLVQTRPAPYAGNQQASQAVSNLPASPVPSVPGSGVSSTGSAAKPASAAPVARPAAQSLNQAIAPLEREVQTGSYYRVCPPPPMPSQVRSSQLYAVPAAVAAAWECYGPREMAYEPRPWHGPDPAVHSPLPVITQTKATRTTSSKKTKAAPVASTTKPSTPAPSTPTAAVSTGQMPVPTVNGTAALPVNGGVATSPSLVNRVPGEIPKNGAATNGNGVDPYYRPAVMNGQNSVAAPIIVPSAPSTAQNGVANRPAGQTPYNGEASSVPPSRDIVDTGENGARVAQAPTSLLEAPPLTPNPTPTPSGFTPR